MPRGSLRQLRLIVPNSLLVVHDALPQPIHFTGAPLGAVAVGYVHMMRLAHLAGLKAHARDEGPRDPLTRQPTAGRAKDGGYAIGWMEGRALAASGAWSVLSDLWQSSDPASVQACACGFDVCAGGCTPVPTPMPFAAAKTLQLLRAFGVGVRKI